VENRSPVRPIKPSEIKALITGWLLDFPVFKSGPPF